MNYPMLWLIIREDTHLGMPNICLYPTSRPIRSMVDTPPVGTDYSIGYLSNGETEELIVNPPPGEYTVICPAPGHEAEGMVGTLIAR